MSMHGDVSDEYNMYYGSAPLREENLVSVKIKRSAKNARESFEQAMNQELLNLVSV